MSDTPRTDEVLRKNMPPVDGETAFHYMDEHARKLERELAEITKQRDDNRLLYETEKKDMAFLQKTLKNVIAERDEASKQRDTLAEALREIKDICLDKTIELHSDDDCKGMVDDLLEIAAKALAATKGGSHE